MQKIKNIIIVTLTVLVIILIWRGCNADKLGVDVSNYEKLQDTVKFYKNKSGLLVARTSVLEGNNATMLLHLKSRDEEIIKLQKTVNEYKKKIKNGGSVTNFNTGTTINNTTATIVDSLPVNNPDSVVYVCNPTYKTTFTDKFLEYSLQANKDSTTLHLTHTDKFSVIIGEERPKMFSKKETFVDVVSESPYTKVKSVKAFKVTDKRKPTRISVGVQGGYGLTLFGATPYVGVGVQFNILNIR